MFEEAGCVACGKVAISGKVSFEFKVSHTAYLGQAIHASSNLYKNTAVVNFCMKLVLAHDVQGNIPG